MSRIRRNTRKITNKEKAIRKEVNHWNNLFQIEMDVSKKEYLLCSILIDMINDGEDFCWTDAAFTWIIENG